MAMLYFPEFSFIKKYIWHFTKWEIPIMNIQIGHNWIIKNSEKFTSVESEAGDVNI